MSNGQNEATRLLDVIGKVVDQKTKSGAKIEVTYGQVFQLSGNYASVYLAGSRELSESDGGVPEPSENFRVPFGMVLSPDDNVRVAIDDRGHRWIEEYLPVSAETLQPNTDRAFMLGRYSARLGWALLGRGAQLELAPVVPETSIDFTTGTLYAKKVVIENDVSMYLSSTHVLSFTGRLHSIRLDSADISFSAAVTGDTARRWSVNADGRIHWGSGSGPIDINLFRHAAATLRTDNGFWAAGGVITRVKSGIPVDADLAAGMVQNGIMVVDQTNSRFYVRVGGVWKYAALT